MKFPLQLSFKLLALASQIFVRDADGRTVAYVKQKLFKLKEDIRVFSDESQQQLMYLIKADRIIDFSARYNFSAADGRPIGSIKRQGMRSLWRAHYEISDANGNIEMEVREENGFVKVADALVGEIPIIGMFTGYFFNPSYIVTHSTAGQVARLSKKPSFFERGFEIERIGAANISDELLLLSVLTMTLLERSRG